MQGLGIIAASIGAAWIVAGQRVPKPGADGRYTISAPGIRAQFIAYGATLTNLFVNDKNGKEVDVVLGYDDAAYYPKDTSHPTYNSIPGRYANRIVKAQFTIDGKTYRTQKNDGQNTLHSGTNNWSYRFWNVTAVSTDSITFSIVDKEGEPTGMPGTVLGNVTYSVAANATWNIKMMATSADVKTLFADSLSPNADPAHLLQSRHVQEPVHVAIWDHTLSIPYSRRYLAIDGGALPTGQILTASAGSINDFASGTKPLGHARSTSAFRGNCGSGCEGYSGFWVFDDNTPKDAVVLTLASPWSGIKADLRTNQVGVVLYTCAWSDGSASLKKTQGTGGRKKAEKSSCIAIEAQDYVDGINRPAWGRVDAQVTGPGELYLWSSSWTFSQL